MSNGSDSATFFKGDIRLFLFFVSDKNHIHDPSPLEKVSAATILRPESFVKSIGKNTLKDVVTTRKSRL